MEDFIKTYGLFWATSVLVVVTFWYAFATFRMASIMRAEAEMKTTPRIGAMKPAISSSGWKSFCAEQTLVNTGLSAVFIEWAAIEWWAYDMQKIRHVTPPKEPLPMLLGPGMRTTFTFEIDEQDLNQYAQSTVEEASTAVTGIVFYRFTGVDGHPEMREFNLPEPIGFLIDKALKEDAAA